MHKSRCLWKQILGACDIWWAINFGQNSSKDHKKVSHSNFHAGHAFGSWHYRNICFEVSVSIDDRALPVFIQVSLNLVACATSRFGRNVHILIHITLNTIELKLRKFHYKITNRLILYRNIWYFFYYGSSLNDRYKVISYCYW